MRVTRTLLALCFAAASSALAQNSIDARNFSLERLRISLDHQGLIDVEAPTTPGHLKWEAGLWLGLSRNPVVLYDKTTGDRLGALLQDRDSAAVWASVGISKYLRFGLEIPVSLYQWRSPSIPGVSEPLQRLAPVALGNIRLAAKVGIVRQEFAGVSLALEAALGVPSGSSLDYVSDPSFTFSPELSLGRAWGRFRTAINVGVFLRNRTQFLNLVVHHELTARMGFGYRFGGSSEFDAPWALDASVSTATRLARPFADANNRSLEVRLMGSRAVGSWAQVFVGGGLGVLSGVGTPDWRVFAGLRFFAPDVPPPPPSPAPGVDCSSDGEESNGLEDPADCPDERDPDRDRLAGSDDECPNQPGSLGNKGCPDADADAIVDAKDRCPYDAEDFDAFEDQDGCPDLDNDSDGLADPNDKCPLVEGPADNNGCPDSDKDQDGIVDRNDNCPDEKGPPKNQGCPKSQLVVVSSRGITILDNVFFKPNSDVIQTRSFKLLENVVKVMQAHPELEKIRVEGHTDNQGNADKNLALSERRAASVVAHLVRHGVDPTRLTARGYGPTRPVDSNATDAGRAKNRRVVFTVVGPDDADSQP